MTGRTTEEKTCLISWLEASAINTRLWLRVYSDNLPQPEQDKYTWYLIELELLQRTTHALRHDILPQTPFGLIWYKWFISWATLCAHTRERGDTFQHTAKVLRQKRDRALLAHLDRYPMMRSVMCADILNAVSHETASEPERDIYDLDAWFGKANFDDIKAG